MAQPNGNTTYIDPVATGGSIDMAGPDLVVKLERR
jgi:hypothetical protein